MVYYGLSLNVGSIGSNIYLSNFLSTLAELLGYLVAFAGWTDWAGDSSIPSFRQSVGETGARWQLLFLCGIHSFPVRSFVNNRTRP